MRLEYWTALRQRAQQRHSPLRILKPLAQAWTNVALGRANCYLVAVVNSRDKEVAAHVVLGTEWAKQHLRELEA
ncbi:MAG: DUF4268 domain-containing protein [Vicinamibacterales bacterium]